MLGKIWDYTESCLDFIAFKILHLKLSKEKWNSFLQFVKFGIVGASNTVVSYIIYIVSLVLFQKNQWFSRTDYLIAQIIAFVLSVLWSFFWNNKYVFKSEKTKRPWIYSLMKTYISYAFTGLFLNSILSVLWVQIFHVSKLISPLINLLVSVPINFVLNKFWAFK